MSEQTIAPAGEESKRWYEHASNIVSVATAAIIAFSVLFDWGYFQEVSPTAFGMMSVADHVSSAVEHLPTMLMVSGPVLGVIVVLLSTLDSIHGVKIPKRFGKLIVIAVVLVLFGTVTTLAVGSYREGFLADYMSSIGIRNAIQLMSSGLGLLLVVLVLTQLMSLSIDAKILAYVFYVILFVSISVGTGGVFAVSDLNERVPTHALNLTTGEAMTDVRPLRTNSAGMLLILTDVGTVNFITWDSISELVALRPRTD